ncbi:MAG TPA: hypothetical protein VIK91_15405, partial [Nannocystis sp.]
MPDPDCAEGGCVDNVCTMVECLVDADCDGLDSACLDATCDPNTYTCVTAPANEGGPCEDDDLCSATSICQAGACVADQPVDCSDLDDACNTGVCNPDDGTCHAAPVNEGGPCEDDDLCSATSICQAGACVADQPVDCSDLDDFCGVGVCDPQDGQCKTMPQNEGMPCDDGNICTPVSTCNAGVCGDPQAPQAVLFETFADNSAGWVLDQNWQIGPAMSGCGDPALDHTPTADNGIAGVVIGGCAPTEPVNANLFYCLTSPPVDTTSLPTVLLSYWRHLWSDYTPYMKNKIEVFNGNSWVVIFETFGSPGVDDPTWTKFEYNITPHSNAALRVRWCYNIGS